MRFLIVLIVIAGLIIGWFKIKENRKGRQDRQWVSQLAPLVGKFTGGSPDKKTTGAQPDEAAFFQLLFFFHKAEESGVDMNFTSTPPDEESTPWVDMSAKLDAACKELNVPPLNATVKESLKANYAEAKKLHILDDLDNLLALERGEPATVKLPGWEKDKAVVAHIISPLYAPEAAQNLGNLQIIPASVRDAMDEKLTPSIIERARRFQSANIITRETFDKIYLMLQPAK